LVKEPTGLTSITFKEILLKNYLTVALRILDPALCSLSDVTVAGLHFSDEEEKSFSSSWWKPQKKK